MLDVRLHVQLDCGVDARLEMQSEELHVHHEIQLEVEVVVVL